MQRPSYLDVLEDLSNDDLAEAGANLDTEYNEVRKMRDRVNGEVLRRLGDTTMGAWGDVAVFREESFGTYLWDINILNHLLLTHLHPAQRDEVIEATDVPAHTEYKVNTAALKKYASKLGDVGRQMLACGTRKANAPRVRYERIQPLEEQLAASVAALKEKS